MRLRIRDSVAVVCCAASVLAVGLTGCSNGAASDGPVTLTYLTHFNQSPGKDVEAKAVAAFEKANPKVKVNVLAVQSGTETQKFQALASAGDPPSVYDMSSDQFPVLASKHALAPVDIKNAGLGSQRAFESKYLPRVLDGYKWDGKVYGIPAEVSNYGAWVNVKAYSAAGLTMPRTWDDVCAAGPKMLKHDKRGKITQEAVALPTNLPASQVYFIDAIAHEYGGSLFSSDGKTSNLTSKPAQAAFQLIQDLVYKCHATVPSLNSSEEGADRITYGTGDAAMFLTGGSWYLGSLQQQYPKLAPPVSRASEYPSINGKTSSTQYGYAWVVPSGAKNQELAWKLAAALSNSGNEYFKKLGLFNGTQALAHSSQAANTPFWPTWRASLKTASYPAALTNSSQIYDIVSNAFNAVILKKANVASTLQAADNQIKPLLNQ